MVTEKTTDLREKILPFYVVCDESYSMSGAPMQALNEALDEVYHTIGQHPVVSDSTRFAVIGFSDTAEVIQPLANLADLPGLPELTAKGGTSFGSAFHLLKTEISNDVAQLKAANARVYRPCVFFLTDGQPTDDEADWLQALEELTGEGAEYRPNILGFGIGEANADTIRKVGRTRGFLVAPSMSPAAALKEFAVALTRSIIASGSQPEKPQLVVPEELNGFIVLDTEEM